MRCSYFCIFGSGAWQSALGCSLMRYRLFFNVLYEQPRALCHAPPTTIQKYLQRIFAMLYFARSFFDYPFLQQFILRQFFCYRKNTVNSQEKSAQKIFAYLFLH